MTGKEPGSPKINPLKGFVKKLGMFYKGHFWKIMLFFFYFFLRNQENQQAETEGEPRPNFVRAFERRHTVASASSAKLEGPGRFCSETIVPVPATITAGIVFVSPPLRSFSFLLRWHKQESVGDQAGVATAAVRNQGLVSKALLSRGVVSSP